MLAQGSASGRGRHVGTNPIPPARGIGPQDSLALAVAAHCAALRNEGRCSPGLSFSVKTFAAGGAAAATGAAAGFATCAAPWLLAATAAASRDARISASLAAAY